MKQQMPPHRPKAAKAANRAKPPKRTRRRPEKSVKTKVPGSSLITRIHKPSNRESSYRAFRAAITPTSEFFIRNHFPIPHVSPRAWRLQIEGAVKKPVTLSFADLCAMPQVTRTSVLECAGNGRLFLNNVPEGVQWALGAAGCAAWKGVALSELLTQAKILPSAVDLIFQGADHGAPDKKLKPKNKIHYARSLSLADAKKNEPLLAFEMNGAPLKNVHGAPVRLIVPGWYGMASVKWLERIIVATQPFHGYFQTIDYAYWKTDANKPPQRLPLTQLLVKSEIARPAMHEEIKSGSPYRVFGAAWTSAATIESVEVSVDAGRTWHAATLAPPAAPAGNNAAWQLWEWTWNPPSAGAYTLMSRATDSRGEKQPSTHDENFESYCIHHTLPIHVEVIPG